VVQNGKGLSIKVLKDVRSQGGLPSADILRTKWLFRCEVRIFWCKMLWIF